MEFQLTVNVRTGLSAGAGPQTAGSVCPVARDSDGLPTIHASTLRGALRAHLERVLRGSSHPLASRLPESCKGRRTCSDRSCPVCGLFGGIGLPGSLRISDARMVDAGSSQLAPLRRGSCGWELRTAQSLGRSSRSPRLRSAGHRESTAAFAGGLRLCARVESLRPLTDEEVYLLRAAARAVTALGGGKSRGLGRVLLELEGPRPRPATPPKAPVPETPPAPDAPRSVRAVLTAREPFRITTAGSLHLRGPPRLPSADRSAAPVVAVEPRRVGHGPRRTSGRAPRRRSSPSADLSLPAGLRDRRLPRPPDSAPSRLPDGASGRRADGTVHDSDDPRLDRQGARSRPRRVGTVRRDHRAGTRDQPLRGRDPRGDAGGGRRARAASRRADRRLGPPRQGDVLVQDGAVAGSGRANGAGGDRRGRFQTDVPVARGYGDPHPGWARASESRHPGPCFRLDSPVLGRGPRLDPDPRPARVRRLALVSISIDSDGDGPIAPKLHPPGASRGYPKPPVESRAAWGAEPPACNPGYCTVTHLAVHHTAGANEYLSPGYAQCAANVKAIQAYHMHTQGWCDIGYHYLICVHGRIWEGRAGGDDVIGAHDAH
ncbi:MAG: hypothetical protein HY815_19880, partial [Candidatus Riflebacteria bacterium]|nr:hypothetical protein [Candidatus Riflebacteria bacterium]